ncbi:phosphate ABC transporter permease PstA [Candidatus Chloroploca sp. M-50]|uniref:Phosphate transport system permease protein PstA n=1 Tax=Candidatus Chloroploca mongolica TaxID=2528176 RepID=A0ABS4DDH3_9CHLR|nr:phosphate ABC transporter permease PstA [Candidatus Chloroploca mongolica]MBP1467473.1 phosphate ABC transporter permease PstA [Candidatus Chloroploca mongolica]
MSAEPLTPLSASTGRLPQGEEVKQNVASRQQRGKLWQASLLFSVFVGLLVLLLLAWNIVNDAFGGIAVQEAVEVEALTGGRELEELAQPELVAILEENLRSRVLRNLNREQPLAERDAENLIEVILFEIIKPEVVATFSLYDYLFNRAEIEAQLAQDFPRAELEFKSWLRWDFIVNPMSSNPIFAGVRTALLGTLWLLVLTILISFPLGLGAAIYLEEYQSDKIFDERKPVGRFFNRVIERSTSIISTNIYNLSGVPSIIYGMLGLAIFVRALEAFTSGSFFGANEGTTANGRTIISAALTMSLLVLPVVIISSQEAIKAVPSTLRQASLGLGATKWQTIWKIVLPNALPGILTGTILAISRAIGETAPLIVVGASTFIVTDPTSIFSKFTVLPIQIYNWTSRPQDEFRAIAAAAIITLLILLLSLNATAILLRNYLRSRRVS